LKKEIIKLGDQPLQVGNVLIYRNKFVTWRRLKVKVKSEKLRVRADGEARVTETGKHTDQDGI
jgi:stress response protein YsnF